MSGRMWRIVAPHFVAGLVVEEGLVTETAPILARWRGRRWVEVRARMVELGWHGEPCREAP